MLALGLAVGLCAVAVVGIGLQIRVAAGASPSRRAGGAVLPLLFAVLIVLLAPASEETLPKAAVFLGQVMCIVAVGILGTGVLPSYVAYAHLLITYSLYWLAFAATAASFPLWPAAAGALVILALAGLLYSQLASRVSELWSDILVFGFLVAAALWQALVALAASPASWQPWLALLGMLIVALAHTGQALFRFQPRATQGTGDNAPMLPLLLTAHLVIAWSVW